MKLLHYQSICSQFELLKLIAVSQERKSSFPSSFDPMLSRFRSLDCSPMLTLKIINLLGNIERMIPWLYWGKLYISCLRSIASEFLSYLHTQSLIIDLLLSALFKRLQTYLNGYLWCINH